MTGWRGGLVRAGGFLAVLLAYAWFLSTLGGFSTDHIYKQWPELLFATYFYGLFFSFLRPIRGRALFAAVPIIILYIVGDVFYLVYGKVFRFINISELPELLQILPLKYAILVVLATIVPLVTFFIVSNYRRPATLLLWSAPLFFLVFTVEVTPAAYVSAYRYISPGLVKYSDAKSVENNGRLAMLFFREAERSNTLQKLQPYQDRQQYDGQMHELVKVLSTRNNRKNVHLVVLESFLDPRLFKSLKFSRSPVAPGFDQLFGHKLGLSLSPVFGGATAQAEFEVLCGVPAFEKISSVEFNAFTGAPANCLPGVLSQMGYRSVATNAYKPNFFNALPGYTGAGFRERYFPQEFYAAGKSYLHFGDPGEEEYLFDASLFNQNLAFVKQHLQAHPTTPLLNYIMTIYGHTPHLLDKKKRPEIIQLQSDFKDDHLQRATNQFYYRTEAIANYVEGLQAMDKNSLVILISDHVPPLRNGPNTYQALRYMDNIENSYYYNRVAIIEDGKVTQFPPIHHYEIPSIILDYVSDGEYCRVRECDFKGQGKRFTRQDYLEKYLTLMAHASE